MRASISTAIPVCCNHIAYHFAWCTHVLLIETGCAAVSPPRKQSIPFTDAWDMARALVDLNIDQLVCGAMPSHFRDWFESKGVRVIDGQNEALRPLFEGFGNRLREIECAARKSIGSTPSTAADPSEHPQERSDS